MGGGGDSERKLLPLLILLLLFSTHKEAKPITSNNMCLRLYLRACVCMNIYTHICMFKVYHTSSTLLFRIYVPSISHIEYSFISYICSKYNKNRILFFFSPTYIFKVYHTSNTIFLFDDRVVLNQIQHFSETYPVDRSDNITPRHSKYARVFSVCHTSCKKKKKKKKKSFIV